MNVIKDKYTTMFFQNLRKAGDALTFEIHNVDLSVVNSLRRIVLSEIPTVALSYDPLTDNNPDIKIHVNHSALHNEFLAHRISLIPIYFNASEIESFDPSKYTFKIKVKNTGSDIISVTTKDITIYDSDEKPYPESFCKRIFPSNPFTKDHLLITKLRPNIYNNDKGEELDIEFKASVGIAKTHSRWNPVSCCTFYNIVNEEEAKAGLATKLEVEQSTKGRSLTSKEIDIITKRFESLGKYRCFHKNEHGEANAFQFKIESECGLSPEEIFEQAFNILIEKMQRFSEGEYDVHAINDTMVEIVVENEDFTLVNALQSLIYNKKVRDEKKEFLSYIGYCQPHPLDKRMIIKLKFNAPVSKEDIHTFLKDAVDDCIIYVENIKEQWNP